MTNQYIFLSQQQQKELLTFCADKLDQKLQVLEKDFWLCWVLEVLFNMPNAHPMAFKGGTSLSKVYQVIDRFSEDVDITLDYRYFDENIDNLDELSNRQRKILSDKLSEKVKRYANDTLLPYFQSAISELPNAKNFSLKIDDSGEKIHFYYPSIYPSIATSDEYILDYVLVELGGRNVVDPHQTAIIKPYIAEIVPELLYPSGNITVLCAERTFWEKITLAHYECNRKAFRENAHRLSRHWYDLFMLSRHDVGKSALENRALLGRVENSNVRTADKQNCSKLGKKCN